MAFLCSAGFMAWAAPSAEPSSPWASAVSPPADLGRGGKEDAGGRQAALGQEVRQGEQRVSVKPQGHSTPGAAGSAADHKTCFCQREWEQQLLQFLEDLLFLISDHTWLGCFITSIRRQLAHSDKRPSDKSFLYKCWGTVLMFSPEESIKPQLWRLVEMVNFREEEEREGFARALELCARKHLYEIFAILEHWEEVVSRVQLQPSAAGSLEEPASIEQLRSLLLLTYGHVVHSVPTDLILETIGYKILTPMRKHCFLSPHAHGS
ncbi:maestro heat-like repeat-containing protein family member 1 [Gopherus evgoodei]|uniref:maestro heat-like repeat-containing protein family member 1 n=1 Tax=Gopherus evgoodei TaxID=1825980 RepID=UPI0011CFD465|nr:maestro heat-like repeat-containing protein family member 1 [Gopherus evgoodei]